MNPPALLLPPAPRLLVRGVNWLGDAVMTAAALSRVREKYPAARLALLTPEKLGGLWLNHPAVDEIICSGPGEGVFSVARKLRAGRFDLALVLPNSPRSAIEPWLAGIPRRIGSARPWRNFFLTQAIPPRAGAVRMQKLSVAEIKRRAAAEGDRQPASDGGVLPNAATDHQIHEYLHLAAALGANPEPLAPQLFVTPGEVEAAKKKFGLENLPAPVFGLNPGAEYGPAKRWPVEHFIAAAKDIQRRTHCLWILLGGGSDEAITGRIQSAIGHQPLAINLAGRTSLRELMALLKLCRVLLTNDTGPMHLAAALGTPVVALFGSTSPELTGPGLPGGQGHRLLKSDAPCSPCFRRECPIDFRCMNGLRVERVADAVIEALTL